MDQAHRRFGLECRHRYLLIGIRIQGSYCADVRLGGDPNHPRGHAHIYYGSEELASIGEAGEIIVGKLDRGAKKFVEKYLTQIIDGIKQLYYIS